MKILYLANVPLLSISEKLGLKQIYTGGWISSVLNELDTENEYEIVYCFCSDAVKGEVEGEVDNMKFYGFELFANKGLERDFKDIINAEKPDIVHIFGTEYYHTLAMVRAFNNPDKIIIHIQGLVSVCAKHFASNLSCRARRARSFRDILRNENINIKQKKFAKMGKYEVEAIKNVNHIAGRTEWDYACIKQINPKAQYYICNEILRESFYDGKRWNIDECERHTIFVSQANYPIKGFHNVLEAINIIKKYYPDVKVYTAGKSIIKKQSWKEEAYAKLLKKLIKEYDLNNNIRFLGTMDEKQMCQQYLKSNVFVSASSIENSPNSVAEAKILGVPIVSSYVGGVMSMIEHGKDGYLYQADAPYMLAHYIMEIFGDDNKAKHISNPSNDPKAKQKYVDQYVQLYQSVYEG